MYTVHTVQTIKLDNTIWCIIIPLVSTICLQIEEVGRLTEGIKYCCYKILAHTEKWKLCKLQIITDIYFFGFWWEFLLKTCVSVFKLKFLCSHETKFFICLEWEFGFFRLKLSITMVASEDVVERQIRSVIF